MKIFVLIVAAGRGKRMQSGEGIPKQYLPLAGVPMLRHSIAAFLTHPKITNAICVIHPDDQNLYKEATIGMDLVNPVFGGERRQDSVRNGLMALEEFSPDFVLIHDAARPFVSKRIIDAVIDKLQTHSAVIPAIPVEDTIKKYKDNRIEWTVERDDLWRAQTPQGFKFDDIITLHRSLHNITFSDDAALGEYVESDVVIIPGSQNNFKVTTNDDYERAKRVIATRIENVTEEIRVGVGYDIHRFGEFEHGDKRTIKLGGVEIKHDKKIIAHSDGDVVVHAVIDAILGSISAGDIGEHFSDKDSKWKNYDSMEFLKQINHLVNKKGAKIKNIDVNIIIEDPKISPYKKEMAKNISTILNISGDRVNIKAKTREKLGEVGLGEAVECHAVVSTKMAVVN